MKKLTILLLVACLLASCAQEVPADVSVSLAESTASSVISDETSNEAQSETESDEQAIESSDDMSDASGEDTSDTSSEEEDTTEWPYHRNPYEPNETPVTIADDFPVFTDETPDVQKEDGYNLEEYFLVVKIETDRMYVANPWEQRACTVLMGDFSERCEVGDYIFVSIHSFLSYNGFFCVTDAELLGIETNMQKIFEIIVAPEKPVIYLYPEKETQVSVRLDYDGTLTSTYPAYKDGEGWKDLTVLPDGTIYGADGKEYYCLFWEGAGQTQYDFSNGFCVRGEDTEAFLEEILREIGLSAREANEFIIYWLPRMQNNAYNVISFQTDIYTESAKLEIAPKPDSLLRVFMAYYASDAPIEIEPQTFDGFERCGFTVVEWGGAVTQAPLL